MRLLQSNLESKSSLKCHKKILYISFHYPPSATVASLQNKYIVAWLRKYGWDIDIISIRMEDIEREVGPINKALLENEDEKKIHRIKYICCRNTVIRWKTRLHQRTARQNNEILSNENREIEPNIPHSNAIGLWGTIKNFITDEVLSFPDVHARWIRGGYLQGKRILEKNGASLIYATGPPHSSLIIGRLLKNKFNIPLGLDFRDPWVGNPYNEHKTHIFNRGLKAMQRWVLLGADYIRANTEGIADLLASQEPACKEKIGIGGGGFSDFFLSPPPHISGRHRPFVVTHAGNFYGPRNPKNFLLAIKKLMTANEIPNDDIRIRFLGNNSLNEHSLRGIISDPKITCCLEMEMLPHAECINVMLNSDLLVAFQQGSRLQIPAKIYEYLSLGKPILTVAEKDGATWNLITREGFGVCVPDEIEKIAAAVLREYQHRDLFGRQRFYPNAEKYNYRSISQKLNNDLERIIIPK